MMQQLLWRGKNEQNINCVG